MTHLTRLACAALVWGAALPVPAAAAPQTPTPLANAKTIQVTETLFVGNRPSDHITVKIVRPNKIWIEDAPIAAPGKMAVKPSYYVSDGAAQCEYSGAANRFVKGAALKPGDSPDADLDFVRIVSQANLDLLQTGVPGLNSPIGAHLSEPVVQTVTVAGKPMRLYTQGFHSGDRSVTYKTWVDVSTRLPFRQSALLKEGGMQLTLETNFSQWQLNKLIDNSRFAYAPPADATEYKVPKLLAKGTPAPDFEAIAPDGTKVHLSDFKGKPVVLDFWATWCPPCQKSMPHLESVYKQIPAGQVAVLGVCVWDQKAAYDKWLVDKKGVYTFPTAFDPAKSNGESIATKLYGVSGIPTQYVIDKDGQVAAVNVGYDDGDYSLEAALKEQGVAVTVPTEKKTASR